MKTKKITAIILAAMMTLTTAACVAGCELTNVTEPSGISVVSDTTEDTSETVTSDTSDTSFESAEASTVETEASTAISADVTAESTDATTKQTEATTRQTQATTRETTRATSAPTQATQRQATPTPKPTQQTQATQHQATPTPKPTNTPTPTPKPTNTPTPTPKPANLHATADVHWSSSGYYETVDDDNNVVRTEHDFDGWVRGVTVHRASENKRWQIDDATDDEVWRQVQAAGGSHYSISIKNVRDERP